MTTEFKSWEEMSTLEQYAQTWSDMYKDAHGFRPRIDVSTWVEEDFEQEFEWLSETIARNAHEEAHRALGYAQKLESVLTKMIEAGAADRQTALRWKFEAEDLDLNSSFDREHFEFKLSLPFGYITSTLNKCVA